MGSQELDGIDSQLGAQDRVGRDLRALIVDDDTLQLQVTGNLLARAGFKVLFARTGSQALELFRANDFHVAVIDLYLSDVSGVELIRYIRAAPNGPVVRIVAWTSSNDPELLGAALMAGADDVYQKTFPPDVIAAKFRRLFEKSRDDVWRDNEINALRVDVNSILAGQAQDAQVQAHMVAMMESVQQSLVPMGEIVADRQRVLARRKAMFAFLHRAKRLLFLLSGVAAAIAAFLPFLPSLPKGPK